MINLRCSSHISPPRLPTSARHAFVGASGSDGSAQSKRAAAIPRWSVHRWSIGRCPSHDSSHAHAPGVLVCSQAAWPRKRRTRRPPLQLARRKLGAERSCSKRRAHSKRASTNLTLRRDRKVKTRTRGARSPDVESRRDALDGRRCVGDVVSFSWYQAADWWIDADRPSGPRSGTARPRRDTQQGSGTWKRKAERTNWLACARRTGGSPSAGPC
jgi:hypothetical protein